MSEEFNTNENMASGNTGYLPTNNQNGETSREVSENSLTLDTQSNTQSSENEYIIESILLSEIIPDHKQPRKDFSELESLKKSIEHEGLIYPITVAPHPKHTGKYIIVDGERRYRAYKELNKTQNNETENPFKYAKIKARITPTFEQRIGIVVNLMNKGYNCLEIADSMNCLLKEGKKADENFTQKELAEYLGKSQANVSEYLSLQSLPDDIKNKERNNPCVPFNKLKQLATSKVPEPEMVEKYNKLLSEYEEKREEENEEEIKEFESSSNNKSTTRGSRPHNTISTLTKKLDVTSKALGKFKIENISDTEKEELNTKLQKLIDDAQKIQNELGNGTNTNLG